MRRKIAIFLCAFSLLFSIACIACCAFLMSITDRLVSQSQVKALETTMRTYADALDSVRDEIDVTGSQIPVYALTLKKSAQIFRDAQRAADDLEKLTAIEIPLVGNMKPFGAMEEIARDLRDFLPQFSRSLDAAEKSLSGYTEENHDKLIDSIDKTVLLLNINADKLEEQVDALLKGINGLLTVFILAGLAHGGLALAILLIIPTSGAPASTRHRVVFE
ncbi:MAG: hypothetical protein II943_03295 [Victivallales bacterium]|nr:hypothetical protein [Victivallales bacterium]